MCKDARGDDGLFFSRLDSQQTIQDGQEPPHGEYTRGGKEERAWTAKTRTVPHGSQPAAAVETAFRHRGWRADRSRVLAAMIRSGVPHSRVERFRDCGANCSVEISTDGSAVRLRGRYCYDRFCVPCCNARALKVLNNLKAWTENRRPLFITLTLQRTNGRCKSILNHLLRSFSKLREHAAWKEGIDAGAYVVEMTRGAGKDHWHVHLHVIALGRGINKRLLSDCWRKASGGSYIVNISRVNSDAECVSYVAKYATKGWNRDCLADEKWIVELLSALRGRRLLGTFGGWRGRSIEQEPRSIEGWRSLGSLVEIVERARRNDPHALGILRALHVAARWTAGQIEFDDVKSDQALERPG